MKDNISKEECCLSSCIALMDKITKDIKVRKIGTEIRREKKRGNIL